MLAYFLAHNEAECRDMAVQPALRRGVEEFLGMWREVGIDGGANLCSAWCMKHLRMLSPCCTACSGVLQLVWQLVGRPSIQMCVSYRLMVEVGHSQQSGIRWPFLFMVYTER